MDRPPAAHSGNTRGDTRLLFLFESWQYNMAILVSCSYDGNDANDGISLLEQGSVISVMSVITIASVLICSRAGLFICI
jgi:hypothetical protein